MICPLCIFHLFLFQLHLAFISVISGFFSISALESIFTEGKIFDLIQSITKHMVMLDVFMAICIPWQLNYELETWKNLRHHPKYRTIIWWFAVEVNTYKKACYEWRIKFFLFNNILLLLCGSNQNSHPFQNGMCTHSHFIKFWHVQYFNCIKYAHEHVTFAHAW